MVKKPTKIEDSGITAQLKQIFRKNSGPHREPLLQLIKNLAVSQTSSGDFVVHTSLNILFLCVASGYSDCFELAISRFGYKKEFFLEGFNPLDLALSSDHQSILDKFVDYFNSGPVPLKQLSLNQKIFFDGIQAKSEKFRIFIAENMFEGGRNSGIEAPEIFLLRDTEPTYHLMVLEEYARNKKFLEKL